MEVKDMFPHLDSTWIRWTEYAIQENKGVAYLLPTPNAAAERYNAAETAIPMVVDALNMGKLVYERKNAADACLAFARKYGPLGVVCPTKSPLLKKGRDADNSQADIAPSASGIFAQSYGEPLERYLDTLRTLYVHYHTTVRNDSKATKEDGLSDACGFSYRLSTGTPPQLVWQPDNLLALLKLAYALAVANPDTPLKECKKCGKVYYNTRNRSEFCSPRCRNQYNVYKSRGSNRT